MKKTISIIVASLMIVNPVVFAQVSLDYLPDRQAMPSFGGAGIGGGVGMGGFPGTAGNFRGENQQSIPVFQNTGAQYNSVRVNASCPLLTATAKEDTDLFSDLKSFLTTASKKCSLGNSGSNNMAMNAYPGAGSPSSNVSMFEAMVKGDSPSGFSTGTSVTSSSVKCYSANVELIGQRNLAYYYSEKKMTPGMQSSYSSCFASEPPPLSQSYGSYGQFEEKTPIPEVPVLSALEKQKKCISEKYESLVEENKVICKEINAPQSIQNQINKGIVGIEEILNQAIINKDECGFKTQDLFKVTMNTFLKAKALSVVGPWGAVAGFGVDLIGNLLDKIIPSDPQKATAFMEEILNEETFEQNACLYYNIQQKMYCEDRPIEVATMNPSCQNIAVTNDVLNLIQKYKTIQKITDSLLASSSGNMNSLYPSSNPEASPSSAISPELESELVDHLDELANHTIASESDLRDRIKSLPKIQQSREQVKLDSFISKMKEYQKYSPEKDQSGEQGKKLINEIASFFTGKNGSDKWDISMFIVKTTPGTKLENLKQKSIARVIEGMLASQKDTKESSESSRTMARYNKYKNGVSVLSRDKFERRLDKQFKDFETQVKFVASKDQGKVMDSVAEGQLRNLVRHCTLLQEVYDPNLEGSIPRVCQKLSCSNNSIEWFKPQANQQNFSAFKASYCDKGLSFQRIEDSFIKNLKDKTGAKICGVPVGNFF